MTVPCVCVGGRERLRRGGSWISFFLFFTLTPHAKQMNPSLLSVCSFWSGLSGQPVGLALILLAPSEWVKPLMEREKHRGNSKKKKKTPKRLASLLACSLPSCASTFYQLSSNFRIQENLHIHLIPPPLRIALITAN